MIGMNCFVFATLFIGGLRRLITGVCFHVPRVKNLFTDGFFVIVAAVPALI